MEEIWQTFYLGVMQSLIHYIILPVPFYNRRRGRENNKNGTKA
jgi:hypothetical protein